MKQFHEIEVGQKFTVGDLTPKMKICCRGVNFVVLSGKESGAGGYLALNTEVEPIVETSLSKSCGWRPILFGKHQRHNPL